MKVDLGFRGPRRALFSPGNLDIISTAPCIWHSCVSLRWRMEEFQHFQREGKLGSLIAVRTWKLDILLCAPISDSVRCLCCLRSTRELDFFCAVSPRHYFYVHLFPAVTCWVSLGRLRAARNSSLLGDGFRRFQYSGAMSGSTADTTHASVYGGFRNFSLWFHVKVGVVHRDIASRKSLQACMCMERHARVAITSEPPPPPPPQPFWPE